MTKDDIVQDYDKWLKRPEVKEMEPMEKRLRYLHKAKVIVLHSAKTVGKQGRKSYVWAVQSPKWYEYDRAIDAWGVMDMKRKKLSTGVS